MPSRKLKTVFVIGYGSLMKDTLNRQTFFRRKRFARLSEDESRRISRKERQRALQGKVVEVPGFKVTASLVAKAENRAHPDARNNLVWIAQQSKKHSLFGVVEEHPAEHLPALDKREQAYKRVRVFPVHPETGKPLLSRKKVYLYVHDPKKAKKHGRVVLSSNQQGRPLTYYIIHALQSAKRLMPPEAFERFNDSIFTHNGKTIREYIKQRLKTTRRKKSP